jgi:predicted DNA-binding transcriptional regulator
MTSLIKEDVLIESGLSKNEAKVYLALIDIGSATAGELSEKSRIHRTNVYDSLDRLIGKGIATYIFKNEVKYYQATEPENLLNLIKEKELHLSQILPELQLSKKLSKTKPRAEICEGMPAFKLANYELLKYGEPLRMVGIPKEVPGLVKNWIDNFHRERAKRKVEFIHIYNHGAQDRIKYLNNLPYTKARSLPEKYDSPVSIMSCGEEVMIVMWDVSPLLFIRIHNPNFSRSFDRWFNLMWELAK